MSTDHHLAIEDEDFQRMRAYDKEWTGAKFIGVLVATLAVALTIIYGLSSIGSG
ncbi:MAG: hypothetical protein Q8S73_16875 [Deltaproteobacteria bacterium]|jgi:hypothetical protein|nr:hypothetical protein [Myxococcales bacterium]MDP3215783.1 hypothetical protein [Deltaproteobacteria bacterium]